MKYRLSDSDSQVYFANPVSTRKHLEYESDYYTLSLRRFVSEDSENIHWQRYLYVFLIFRRMYRHQIAHILLRDKGDIVFLVVHKFILEGAIQALRKGVWRNKT